MLEHPVNNVWLAGKKTTKALLLLIREHGWHGKKQMFVQVFTWCIEFHYKIIFLLSCHLCFYKNEPGHLREHFKKSPQKRVRIYEVVQVFCKDLFLSLTTAFQLFLYDISIDLIRESSVKELLIVVSILFAVSNKC